MRMSRTVLLGSSYGDNSNSQSKLRQQLQSLFRFTYRRDFPEISPYGITSDTGWGCMIRSAQMLLGNTMLRHYYPTGFNLPLSVGDLQNMDRYKEILQWFVDYPDAPHFYALHHLVQSGMKYDKLPGEWFGPSTVSLVLRDVAKEHRSHHNGPLEIHVTQGDTMYITDIQKLCCRVAITTTTPESSISTSTSTIAATAAINQSTSANQAAAVDGESFFDPLINPPPSSLAGEGEAAAPWDCALLVLMPLMLGISSVNQEYFESLKEVLGQRNCVGILGGRTYHAMYFVGYSTTDSEQPSLLGLDPHTTFNNPPSGNTASDTSPIPFPDTSLVSQIHVPDCERLPFHRMDPSCAVGFYFRDRLEFEHFCQETMVSRGQGGSRGPALFHIAHSPPSYINLSWDQEELDAGSKGLYDQGSDSDDLDEYVFI